MLTECGIIELVSFREILILWILFLEELLGALAIITS